MTEERRDTLSSYLSYAAIRKFLGELSNRYHTVLEKRATAADELEPRADRFPAYLPGLLRTPSGTESYGVMRNVSATGVLMLSREPVSTGDEVTLEAHLGDEVIILQGTATRVVPHASTEFPEFLIGIRLDESRRTGIDRILDTVMRFQEILRR